MSSAFDIGIADGIEKTAAGSRAEAAREFAGLALIAAPVAHGMIQRARGKKLTHRQEQVHAASDLAGLGLLAAPYAKRLLSKSAAAASPDTTGASPTTSGELERDVSAPGVSGRSWAQLDTQSRAESSGRPPSSGRGVPEWARHLKRMSLSDKTASVDPHIVARLRQRLLLDRGSMVGKRMLQEINSYRGPVPENWKMMLSAADPSQKKLIFVGKAVGDRRAQGFNPMLKTVLLPSQKTDAAELIAKKHILVRPDDLGSRSIADLISHQKILRDLEASGGPWKTNDDLQRYLHGLRLSDQQLGVR